MNLPKLRASFGFSLIELMIVITIIGLIGGIGASFASSVQKNTRDAQRQADLQVLQSAIQQFYADLNHYPNGLTSILAGGTALTSCSEEPTCLTTKTYLTKTPKDPNSTTTNYCYKDRFSVTDASPTDSCSSTVNAGTCHFYELYARLENPTGSTTYTCNGVSYNFKVTPL